MSLLRASCMRHTYMETGMSYLYIHEYCDTSDGLIHKLPSWQYHFNQINEIKLQYTQNDACFTA